MKPTDDELLQSLKNEAEALPVIKPRAMAWDKVKANLPTESVVSKAFVPASAQAVAPVLAQVVASDEGKDKTGESNEQSTVVHVSFVRRFKLPLAVAASFAVGVLVTSLTQQLDRVSQLEQQIALSGQYESQLVALRMTNPLVERQLWQISEIDKKLNQATSVLERQQLWLKRNEILRKILTSPVHSNEMI